MTKRVLALCLALVLSLAMVGGAVAAKVQLTAEQWKDHYSTPVIEGEDLVELLGKAKVSGEYNGEPFELDAHFDEIYKALPEEVREKTVFAMNFTAKNGVPTGWESDVVDFVLNSDKDVWVYLIGQYDQWNTDVAVPLGPIKMEKNADLRVMKDLFGAELNYGWIYSFVNSFNCGAILITDEWIKAAQQHGGMRDFNILKENAFSMVLNEDFASEMIATGQYGGPLKQTPKAAAPGTGLTVGLHLYDGQVMDENDRGFIVTTSEPMIYPGMPPVAPKTGDNAMPILWVALCAVSLVSVAVLRKKAYAK